MNDSQTESKPLMLEAWIETTGSIVDNIAHTKVGDSLDVKVEVTSDAENPSPEERIKLILDCPDFYVEGDGFKTVVLENKKGRADFKLTPMRPGDLDICVDITSRREWVGHLVLKVHAIA